MSTEIDKMILELLRKEITDDETYELAVKLYRCFKEGGSRRVKEMIYNMIREIGVESIGDE
ncbi:MAG: hypothetical protein GXO23_05740 [Crenarchaeota archaeon]|nr:hypothetical protein [Thermoproteota archaeon]